MTTPTKLKVAEADTSWPSLTVFSGSMMLSSLGQDLRHLYDDVTDAVQPDDLIRMAALIDARRNGSTPDA